MNKKMEKKMKDNKGFSLVELIVVIAIMAILAVTLAPRLTQYIEKARKASDNEVIHTVYSAVKLGLVDDKIEAALTDDDGVGTEDTAETGIFTFELNGSGLYVVTGKEWVSANDATEYDAYDNAFVQEIIKVVGDFKFKSNDADANTEITVTYDTNEDTIKIGLDYDPSDAETVDPDYEVEQ